MSVVDVSAYFAGVDPLAETKTVIWRPVTPGTALKVGDPVCYCKDAQDYKERTTNPSDRGATYAEGSQNYSGRLFIVEEPLVDNIAQFAGIVAKLGPLAGADGDTIVIYKANSGAVVPANVVLTATTAGRTILAVMVGTRTLGSPTMDMPDFLTYSDGIDDSAEVDWTAGTIDSKVVGIAMETLTAAGLCWVKLDENAFVYQGGQMEQEYRVEAVDDDVTLNKMNVRFGVTAGHCQMLYYRAVLAGTGGDANKGVYRFETVVTGVPAVAKHVFGLESHLELGADWAGGQASPLRVTVRSKNVNPDLSLCGNLSAIHVQWHLRKTSTGELENPPEDSALCILYINADTTGTEPANFMVVESMSNIGAYQSTTDAPAEQTGDLMIPIVVHGLQFYLVGFQDTGL